LDRNYSDGTMADTVITDPQTVASSTTQPPKHVRLITNVIAAGSPVKARFFWIIDQQT